MLAWPPDYFHNYKRLLREFQIESAEVRLPFCVEDTSKRLIFTQNDRESEGWTYFREDLMRWRKMINLVK